MTWETHALAADRFDDFTQVVNPRRRADPCRCLAVCPRLGGTRDLWRETREQMMRRLSEREPPAGVLVYRDNQAVGWCQVVHRSSFGYLRTSPGGESKASVSVWAITCLVVRPGARRQGVSASLIEGAVAYAAARGARAIEAYPVNPRGRIDPGAASVGTKVMFDRAGFLAVGVTDMSVNRMLRLVMRRELN